MAIKVKRSHLQHDYSWTATKGDDPKATLIDKRFLNRREGYEVLLMIQQVADHCGFRRIADVQRVEAAIAEALPGNVRGRKKVFAWLVERLCTPLDEPTDEPADEPIDEPTSPSAPGAPAPYAFYPWWQYSYHPYLWACHAHAWAYWVQYARRLGYWV